MKVRMSIEGKVRSDHRRERAAASVTGATARVAGRPGSRVVMESSREERLDRRRPKRSLGQRQEGQAAAL